MEKEGWGSMENRVTKSGKLVVVRWYNNSSVSVTSTFVGISTTTVVKWWSTKENTFASVDWPETIEVYSNFMGGVDKMDFLISFYPLVFRTRRWPTRVILHLVSMSLVNAWIEYKEREADQGSRKKNVMDLLSFYEYVVEAQCKPEANRKQLTSRSSFQRLLNYCPVPKKKTKPAVLPNHECWYDGFDHWPQPNDFAIPHRCKMERCKGKSCILCEKCNVFLCLTKEKKLFLKLSFEVNMYCYVFWWYFCDMISISFCDMISKSFSFRWLYI